MTITESGDGTLQLVDCGCYTETQPLSGHTAGLLVEQAIVGADHAARGARRLVANPDGTFSRPGVLTNVGFSPANQPSPCNATSTPLPSDWLPAWGNTCRCTNPADSLPPFSKTEPYDCRVIDLDHDGFPGVSAFASTSPPATPESDASGLSWARLMVVSRAFNTWTITPQDDGRHTATATDSSQPAVVGLQGRRHHQRLLAGDEQSCQHHLPTRVQPRHARARGERLHMSLGGERSPALFTGISDPGGSRTTTVCPPP